MGAQLNGRRDTNQLHRWKIGWIDVVFLHIHQAIAVNLVPKNPAPQIDPVGWMVKRNNNKNFFYFARLLLAHAFAKSP